MQGLASLSLMVFMGQRYTPFLNHTFNFVNIWVISISSMSIEEKFKVIPYITQTQIVMQRFTRSESLHMVLLINLRKP